MKLLLKKAEYVAPQQDQSDYKPAFFSSTSSPMPDYLKNYNEPLFGGFEAPKSEGLVGQESPMNYGSYGSYGSYSYGGEGVSKYGDYN